MVEPKRLIKFLKPAVESLPCLACAYRYARDSRRLFARPVLTPMGFRFIGNRAMEQGLIEQTEIKVVRMLLEEADVFINAGANIGFYCCLALSMGKYALAFEPLELNLRYLHKNIKANGWQDNIEIFPMALSSRAGYIRLYGSGTGASLIKGWAGANPNHSKSVPVSTLDQALGSRFSNQRCLILVDVEGAEKDLLEGAEYFLRRQPKPIWVVEITVTEHQPAGISVNPGLAKTFRIFSDCGYQPWTAELQPRKVDDEEINRLSKGECGGLQTRNFIFIDKGRGEDLLKNVQ